MKLLSEGTWWLRCKSDPQWDCNGRAHVGGLVMPQECEDKIEGLKETLGKPPDDLEWGYMKD